jgi:hypothetical protein
VLKEGVMAEEEQNDKEKLWQIRQLHERPFHSTVPLFGPLIVAFRSAWNSVAAKWALRSLIQQQSEFNTLTVQHLNDFESQVAGQMIEQDREQTHLLRETAELAVNLNHLNQLLQALDERLARLEALEKTVEEE